MRTENFESDGNLDLNLSSVENNEDEEDELEDDEIEEIDDEDVEEEDGVTVTAEEELTDTADADGFAAVSILREVDEALVEEFQAQYGFPLDDFQIEAIRALSAGESVMVAAPTGTGKTVVAEFGIFQAYRDRKRVFYTTPIKALSNQKFKDLRQQYGDGVGLLTGDVIENPNGHIIVMTTEVLRNMLLQTPEEFTHTTCVVFDEIHYLADSERGTTWEESIILCPKNIQLVCLSATIANASEIADWISHTHRPTRLITHTRRSVPLSLYYFMDGQLNMVIDRHGRRVANFSGLGGEAKRRFKGRLSNVNNPDTDERSKRERPEPTPREIVDALEKARMLPAIYFMFSRNDCEVAAELVAMNKLEVIKDREVLSQIDEVITRYLLRLDEEDRKIQQVQNIVKLARRGLGFHHAGLLPILKQLVEELFTRSLMSVVFATDTLALGVNMPAKSVVVGRMSKFDGQTRRPLLPNEFQQMAGRAGRRGLDTQGHVVVPYSPWIGFDETVDIATGPLLPVESAFSVRYNSVLNLWDPPKGDRVLQVMRHSLLEFQQGRRLRELAAEVHAAQQAYDNARVGCLIGYPEGEELLHEYDAIGHKIVDMRDEERRALEDESRLRAKIEERPWRRPLRETLRQVFRNLAPGTLLHTEDNGWGIYLGRGGEGGVGLFLFGDHTVRLDEYRTIDYLPPERFQVTLPEELANVQRSGVAVKQLLGDQELGDLQQQLAAIELPDLGAWLSEAREKAVEKYGAAVEKAVERGQQARIQVKELKEKEKVHPCHSCEVRKKHRKLQKETAKLLLARDEARERYQERKEFEEGRLQAILKGITGVLRRFTFLDKDGHITAKAAKLRDVFDSNGLIIVEMISRGWLDEMMPHDLAEIFSWFAYDRDFEFVNHFVIPRHLADFRRKLDELERDVFVAERQNDLMISNGYNAYFFGAARAWSRGVSLSDILEKMQLAEGDIIITFNKTIDLMRQIIDMLRDHDPENPLIASLQEAKRLIRRGVVEQVYNIGFGVLKDTLEGDGEDEETTNPVQDQTGIVSTPATTIPTPVILLEDEEEEQDTPPGEDGQNLNSSNGRRFGKRRGKPGRYMGTRRR
jgi:ATP-dependent RNA helicase HelY